jgi:streptogramin lyase
MLAALGILVATGATVAALAAAGVLSREGASQAPPRPPAAEPAPAGPPQAAPAEVVAPPPGAEPAAVPAAVSSEPIQLTGTPIDIAVGDGRVWTITEEGDLYEIDAARNQVVGAPTRLSIREGTLRALEYDAARDALWLGQTDRSQRGFLVRLDPATRQPVGATLRVGDFPVDLALGGGYVWVLTGGDPSKPSTTSALVKIDGASGEIVAGPAEIGPAGAANLAVADDAVWITEYELHQVLRVDPSTLEVVGEPIEIDGFPLRIELAAGRPWFTYEGVESLGRIDPSANEVVGTRLQVDGAPFFMDADERGIWVATGITNTLHWIDPELEQVVATVPASADPGPVAAGAGKVWVGSFKDDTITSFDPRAIERSPAEPGTPDEPGQPPESGSLPPGTYSASGFEPRFSFSVQEGWWKNLSLPQVFSIVQDRVTNPGLDFGRPDAVFTGTALDTEPFPDDVIAWLRSRPGVEVSEATTVTVGGHGGRQVDVQLVEPPEEYPRDCVTPCLPLFAYGERGLMQLELGPPTRIIELDVDGITVIVTIGMSRGTEVELEEFRRRAEAVLRTVVFG